MKSIRALFALFAIVVVSAASAQGPGGPPPGRGGPPGGFGRGPRMKPGEREKKMLDQLNLSAAQKKKAYHLVDDMVARRSKLMPAGGRPSGPPTPEMRAKFQALRPKMDAIRDDFRAKLAKVLTPAQNKKLEAMMAAMRARFGGMRGRGGGGPGGPGGPGH